ncbi:MAG: FHA domain-containing protein [Anaerolineae bacterium]
MLRLVMRRGPTPGAVYDLEGDEITIGRGSKNHIVIRDNEVSRDHCRLVRLAGNYEVHDLNSSNGTFVNGQRVVTPWLLQSGALIELGDSITLEYGDVPLANGLSVVEQITPIETKARFSLRMIAGPSTGTIFPLSGNTMVVGRDVSSDLVIQDPEISRRHLRLRFIGNGYHVEDLGSTNGTFVNGDTVNQSRCLEPNDLIQLGTMVQVQYVVRDASLEDDEEDTPVVRPAEYEYDKNDTLASFFRVDPTRRAKAARSTGLLPGALRDHLMIVYAREDWEALVAPLLVRLQDTRLNAWVDQYLALGSDDWRIAVEQALNECWLMVVMVSPNSLGSAYVHLMYRYFLNQNKPVIPLVRDAGQSLPSGLTGLRATVYDPETNPGSFHKLIFEIMQLH